MEAFQKGDAFWRRMVQEPFNIIFLDLKLPDVNGMDVLYQTKKRYDNVEVIIITGYGSIDSAISAIKIGAYHYVTKPFKLDEIRLLTRGAREKMGLREENRRLRQAVDGQDILKGFIGTSPAMQEIFKMIGLLSTQDVTVLITGESGVGKELVARAIHDNSPRRDHPFVAVNCSAIPENLLESELFGYEQGAFTGAIAQKRGRFERAHQGTIFLDEIGEISPFIQVKLLRALQEKEIARHTYEKARNSANLALIVKGCDPL